MITANFIDNAKVMSKGQVTIPKNIRAALGVSTGDRVTFIVEGGTVKVINSAIYAMQKCELPMTEVTGFKGTGSSPRTARHRDCQPEL